MAASSKYQICKSCEARNLYYYKPYLACLKCKEPLKDEVDKPKKTAVKPRKKRVETKKRKCGNCGKTGHNKATCKGK